MKLKISIISLICLIAVVAGIVAHNARSDALNDEKNAGEQVVSFFRKDYQPLLEEVREEALGSKLILEVKGRKKQKICSRGISSGSRIDKGCKRKNQYQRLSSENVCSR
ncbi:MAG: hypothetical protein ACLTAS_13635 [Butyribacter sp.]